MNAIRSFGAFLLLSFLFSAVIRGQSLEPIVDFLSPDTVCAGSPVNITNLTTGGSTFYWNFCTGNVGINPQGMNIGNPGNFFNYSVYPVYLTLAKDGGNYYSFITLQPTRSVVRYYHGSSFANNPISWTMITDSLLFTDVLEGIKIKQDNGNWYGFVCNNTGLVRMDFGNSLANTPILSSLGPFPELQMAHCINIVQEGTEWLALISSTWGNRLVRLNFGNSLANVPSFQNLGNLNGTLYMPAAFSMVQENGSWYMIVSNAGDGSLSRVEFGNSLLNTPIGINLGLMGPAIQAFGITLINDCGSTHGFMSNCTPAIFTKDLLWRLNFPSGINGRVTVNSIGDIGGLDRPGNFSEIFRQNDTLFTYLTNLSYTSPSLSRLYFVSCPNSLIPPAYVYDPPPYSYDQPGNYNIRLIVNEGQPDQVSLCKNIVVMSDSINIGNDTTICNTVDLTLNAGKGDAYLWSTGATSPTLRVNDTGTYWVRVSHWGCEIYDTIHIKGSPPMEVVDTVICYGTSYFAEGKWQTQEGTYHDTIPAPYGCDTIRETRLGIKPDFFFSLGGDSLYCNHIVYLHATVPGASYQWQDGSTDSTCIVDHPGTYSVKVTLDDCSKFDSVIYYDCITPIWFPTSFTPNGDGLNDTFRPVGKGVKKFSMQIFDRWGGMIYETQQMETGWDGRFKGEFCPDGTYIYLSNYEMEEPDGSTHKVKGTLILLR